MSALTEGGASSDCCSPERQGRCCEPDEKTVCCSPAFSSCGCSAGSSGEEIREAVRARYSDAAKALLKSDPAPAGSTSLGCGNPIAIAELRPGETVLDLGSGGGIDVLLSARRVGPNGRVFGLDMTDEMLELARRNQHDAGIENVEWLRGEIEAIPLPPESVDVVISNCVVNLSTDKPRALAEAARVLKPGGRFAVSDVIADENMDETTRADIAQWTGCIAGALTRGRFEHELRRAGFEEIEIVPTDRVHRSAAAAIVRARKPSVAPRRPAGDAR
ncbi:MAG TPA: arsenite methyltransferase [Solirubrobacterales bacterium]|jgi:SAM-dependent methyltransferase